MQYFLDKLKEFLVFFNRCCNVLRIKSKKRQITFCQGLQGICSTPAVRPYTVPRGVIVRGERMKVNERRTVVGGLIGHCVSPNLGEIDATGFMALEGLNIFTHTPVVYPICLTGAAAVTLSSLTEAGRLASNGCRQTIHVRDEISENKLAGR